MDIINLQSYTQSTSHSQISGAPLQTDPSLQSNTCNLDSSVPTNGNIGLTSPSDITDANGAFSSAFISTSSIVPSPLGSSLPVKPTPIQWAQSFCDKAISIDITDTTLINFTTPGLYYMSMTIPILVITPSTLTIWPLSKYSSLITPNTYSISLDNPQNVLYNAFINISDHSHSSIAFQLSTTQTGLTASSISIIIFQLA